MTNVNKLKVFEGYSIFVVMNLYIGITASFSDWSESGNGNGKYDQESILFCYLFLSSSYSFNTNRLNLASNVIMILLLVKRCCYFERKMKMCML